MKKTKGATLAFLAGATLLSGSCLGNINWNQLLLDTAVVAGTEFLLDNDAVFDLFEDGDVTAE